MTAVMRQELADIEPDAAGADDRYSFTRFSATKHDVGIAGDFGMGDARDLRYPRHDPRCQNDMVEASQIVGTDVMIQPERDAVLFDDAPVVAKRLGELVLARN